MQDFLLAFVIGLFLGGPAYMILYPYNEVYQTLDHYEAEAGGVNALTHSRDLIDANFDKVVKPNNDTLYSLASLDLADGPLILTVPPMAERYWSVQFLATSTEVEAVISRREYGGDGGRYALLPPGYDGAVPTDVTAINLPSSRYWMLIRILVDGAPDLGNVHGLQDGLQLEAL